MKIQELLDKTNEILSIIQLNHRNTLNANYNLHAILWDIKDFFYDFIDEIGEDVVITWGKADFAVVSVDKLDSRQEIYTDSVEKLEEYLLDLENFYMSTDNDEIQNEYMWKSKELRKMFTKLVSVCPEMAMKENKKWEKEIAKTKLYLWIKKHE